MSITVSRERNVTILCLNEPQRLNVIDTKMADELGFVGI